MRQQVVNYHYYFICTLEEGELGTCAVGDFREFSDGISLRCVSLPCGVVLVSSLQVSISY